MLENSRAQAVLVSGAHLPALTAAAKYESGAVPIMSLATFRQILLKTQRDGYGANLGEWVDDKKVSAIAVPVRGKNGLVFACVNVVAVTRAIKPQQLAARFLDPLKAAAASIEISLSDSGVQAIGNRRRVEE